MGYLVLCLILGMLTSSQAEVYRLCENSLSVECVQNQLHRMSGCTPVKEVKGLDPYIHKGELVVPNPFINVTVVRYTNKIVGISDALFADFYVDTEAMVTVLVTKFEKYVQTGNGFAIYHRPGLLDIVVDTSYEFTNEEVTVTTIFSGIENISLRNAQVHSFVDVVKDYYTPNAFEGLAKAVKKYPLVAEVRNYTKNHLDIKFREDILVVGPLVNNVYLNRGVCTFKNNS